MKPKSLVLTLLSAISFFSCKPKENPVKDPDPIKPSLSSKEYITISNGDGKILLATKNLGATTSTESGYFLSWGESKEKDSYSDSAYNFTELEPGQRLRPEEDAASVLLGNEWRMPTAEELSVIKAAATSYSVDGVNGRLIAGDNGEYTFMPAGGYKQDKDLKEANTSIAYWAANASNSGKEFASFWYSGAAEMNAKRSYGLNIRPVRRANVQIAAVTAKDSGVNSESLSASVNLGGLSENKISKCYFELYLSLDSKPQIIEAIYANGSMEAEASSLYPHIKYWVKACLYSDLDGYYFSEISSFDNVEEYIMEVDMGVSVNWCSYNLGTELPHQRGNYYSWGETIPRDGDLKSYTYEKSPYNAGDEQSDCPYLKYNLNDELSTLEREDDAASQYLGYQWRIPTRKEWKELVDNCDMYFATCDKVSGRLLVSKINGKSIFFPFEDRGDGNFVGYYWSSNIRLNESSEEIKENKYHYDYAYFACLSDKNFNDESIEKRYSAMLIRPVKKH